MRGRLPVARQLVVRLAVTRASGLTIVMGLTRQLSPAVRLTLLGWPGLAGARWLDLTVRLRLAMRLNRTKRLGRAV